MVALFRRPGCFDSTLPFRRTLFTKTRRADSDEMRSEISRTTGIYTRDAGLAEMWHGSRTQRRWHARHMFRPNPPARHNNNKTAGVTPAPYGEKRNTTTIGGKENTRALIPAPSVVTTTSTGAFRGPSEQWGAVEFAESAKFRTAKPINECTVSCRRSCSMRGTRLAAAQRKALLALLRGSESGGG